MDSPQTIQPNIPPIEPKKSSWVSKHMLLGIVFLLAIIAAAISGIYYWQTISQIPSSVQFPIHKDVTADWKTYNDVDYSLKYPATWYLNISSPGFVNITNYDSSMVPASDAPESPENIWINISMYPPGKYNNFSANETLESWVNKMGLGLSGKQNILVDGIKAIRGINTCTKEVEEESGYCKKGELDGDIVMVVYNSKGYQISYSPYGSKFISTFDQILSTFKFTK